MKTLSFMFVLLSVLLAGCNDDENAVGDKILTFYLELTDESGNPIITDDKEAGAFPTLVTIPVSPRERHLNFQAAEARKGTDGRYYFGVTNHSASGDEYKFKLHSRGGINGEYEFETSWNSVNLKSIKVNGSEITPGKISFDGKNYAAVSLRAVR